MSNYLGVDPGCSKTGLALVAADGKILALHIAMTDNLAAELRQFVGSAKLQGIIMGNGTNNKAIGAVLRELYPDLVGLLVPPEPLDAYAAVVQVRRWLKKNEDMD